MDALYKDEIFEKMKVKYGNVTAAVTGGWYNCIRIKERGDYPDDGKSLGQRIPLHDRVYRQL